MSVLAREEILRRIDAAKPTDVEGLLITPLDRADIDRDSVDLRLGSRFLVPYPYKVSAAAYRDSQLKAVDFQQRVDVPSGEHIVVPAHSTILGSVYEYIKLPYDVSGQILTKSSLARLFITIEGAPWVHPLYRGCLTLEIANASGTPIRLQPRQPIAQLVLFQVDGARKPDNDVIETLYLGPLYPELI